MFEVIVPVATAIGGAVLGILGTFLVTRKTEAARRQATLAAIMLEIQGNAFGVLGCATTAGRQPAELADDKWRDLQVVLLEFVPEDLFLKLRGVYGNLPYARAAVAALGATHRYSRARQELDAGLKKLEADWRADDPTLSLPTGDWQDADTDMATASVRAAYICAHFFESSTALFAELSELPQATRLRKWAARVNARFQEELNTWTQRGRPESSEARER